MAAVEEDDDKTLAATMASSEYRADEMCDTIDVWLWGCM